MNYYNEQTQVFRNGKWLRAADATTSLFDQTLHYGTGVFEGIRSYATDDGVKVFKAEEHYERLLFSANSMRMNLHFSVSDLVEITYELLDRNQLTDAYIRPLVYMGPNMRLNMKPTSNLFISAWAWGRYLGNELLNVGTSSYERPNPKSVPVAAKVTGHYTNSVLATMEAEANGYDEALLLDSSGFVAEGSGANFFFEKDGELYTPPTGNILPGITRQTVIDLARNIGVKVNERLFTPEDVYQADSAFFTGTAVEVAGLGSLDRYEFPQPWEETLGFELSKMYTRKVSKNEFSQFDLV